MRPRRSRAVVTTRVTSSSRLRSAVMVTTSLPVFARIAAQEMHPAKAMMEGELQVSGDFELATRLAEMFGQNSLV